MAVAVDVLGPLRVRTDGVEQSVTGRRERAVLGSAGGRRRPPGRRRPAGRRGVGRGPARLGRGSVQVAVSKLRKLLGHAAIVREPGGYALADVEVDAGALRRPGPARRRRRPRRRARPHRPRPSRCGAASPTTTSPTCRGSPPRPPGCATTCCGCTRPAPARCSTSATPPAPRPSWRRWWPSTRSGERLWSLHALALYRCDRQADALAALRTLRESLDAELGIDPSPSVRALEEQILPAGPGPRRARARPPRPHRRPPRRSRRRWWAATTCSGGSADTSTTCWRAAAGWCCSAARPASARPRWPRPWPTAPGRPGSTSLVAAATRATSRRPTGRGCRCCATSPATPPTTSRCSRCSAAPAPTSWPPDRRPPAPRPCAPSTPWPAGSAGAPSRCWSCSRTCTGPT